jgi:hypothetical protein
MTLAVNPELEGKIRRWTPYVEVIGPPELRERFKKHFAKEYARYQLAFDSDAEGVTDISPGKRSVHRGGGADRWLRLSGEYGVTPTHCEATRSAESAAAEKSLRHSGRALGGRL